MADRYVGPARIPLVGRIEGTVMILGSPEARGQGFQRVNAALGA